MLDDLPIKGVALSWMTSGFMKVIGAARIQTSAEYSTMLLTFAFYIMHITWVSGGEKLTARYFCLSTALVVTIFKYL